jgi:hypothetical protein
MKPLPISEVLFSADFAKMAIAMEGAALNEALAIEVLAQWQWKDPDRLKAETLVSCEQRARCLAEVHSLLVALVPHQSEIIALLARRAAA